MQTPKPQFQTHNDSFSEEDQFYTSQYQEKTPQNKSWSQQLCLAYECNGVLTYANPITGQRFAFCRSEENDSPIFLPALSKILYGAHLPSNRNWSHVVVPQQEQNMSIDERYV
ncbi:hypothetical protein HK103_004110 [Boothiomyces macroporosus]|uniref:Uncharacterized protein n=1 Tax=Boothiomyces macroporosus TaxID=261099 RepID=A0AAD5Y618_9FUNG|nr:hypothetical protein HK103_004110 [Boothiomyces macroporosus]